MKLRYRNACRSIALMLGACGFSALAAEAEPSPPSTAEIAPATPQQAVDDGAQNSDVTQLGNVVVTAQKRAQYQKDVPMSLTAISGAHLEQNGQESFSDYAQTIPGLNFETFGEGQNRINIRGMQSITGAATVAYFVDGVSQGFDTGSPDNELFDIDRIEVLRGPQGTLYGEGAVGGAIRPLPVH